MAVGKISALALALSLGLLTTAEAEDWTGARLTFGLSNTAIDFRSVDGGGPSDAGRQDDWSPYLAVGYDWAYGNLTLGVTADVEAATVHEDMLSVGKGFTGESDWFATLRARVGMPVNDQMQVHASAGVAAMGMFSEQVGFFSGSEHKTLSGVAAGVGMDYMLSPGRSLSLEYLHADFGETEFHGGAVTRNPAVDTVRLGYTLRF
jgi:opacity protein-like surface antigen